MDPVHGIFPTLTDLLTDPPAALAVLFAIGGMAVVLLAAHLRRRHRSRLRHRISVVRTRAAVTPTSPRRQDGPAAPSMAQPTSRPPDPGPARAKPPVRPRTVRAGSGGCVWRRDDKVPDTRFRRWTCQDCGVEAFTISGAPPRYCRKSIRNGGL